MRKLTRAQSKLVSLMKKGHALMQVRQGDEYSYNLDGGDVVNRRTVTVLLNRGVLRPGADAMFGVSSQTLVLCEAGQ